MNLRQSRVVQWWRYWRISREARRRGIVLRKPTAAEIERAKVVARERGWLREDGTWKWDDEKVA